MEYIFRILREDPENKVKPQYREYTVDCQPAMTVLDALHAIKWFQDGTLTFRRACRSAICGSCAMMINGLNRLACSTQIDELNSRLICVEPLPGFPVVKDLVVDMDPFFKKLETIKPYLITSSDPPGKERLQSIEERRILDEPINCILCAACTGSCPSFWLNSNYLGPAALNKAYRFVYDSRDEDQDAHLAETSYDRSGVWRCHTIYNCVEACPKLIDLTWEIGKLKNRLAGGK